MSDTLIDTRLGDAGDGDGNAVYSFTAAGVYRVDLVLGLNMPIGQAYDYSLLIQVNGQTRETCTSSIAAQPPKEEGNPAPRVQPGLSTLLLDIKVGDELSIGVSIHDSNGDGYSGVVKTKDVSLSVLRVDNVDDEATAMFMGRVNDKIDILSGETVLPIAYRPGVDTMQMAEGKSKLVRCKEEGLYSFGWNVQFRGCKKDCSVQLLLNNTLYQEAFATGDAFADRASEIRSWCYAQGIIQLASGDELKLVAKADDGEFYYVEPSSFLFLHKIDAQKRDTNFANTSYSLVDWIDPRVGAIYDRTHGHVFTKAGNQLSFPRLEDDGALVELVEFSGFPQAPYVFAINGLDGEADPVETIDAVTDTFYFAVAVNMYWHRSLSGHLFSIGFEGAKNATGGACAMEIGFTSSTEEPGMGPYVKTCEYTTTILSDLPEEEGWYTIVIKVRDDRVLWCVVDSDGKMTTHREEFDDSWTAAMSTNEGTGGKLRLSPVPQMNFFVGQIAVYEGESGTDDLDFESLETLVKEMQHEWWDNYPGSTSAADQTTSQTTDQSTDGPSPVLVKQTVELVDQDGAIMFMDGKIGITRRGDHTVVWPNTCTISTAADELIIEGEDIETKLVDLETRLKRLSNPPVLPMIQNEVFTTTSGGS